MGIKGKFPHIEWLELEGGVLTECAIMKKSADGHIWFFPVKTLDAIDKQRLLKILQNRNAEHYELWDLMSQITLGNGVNALAYFNQLVKVLTPTGQILPFGSGQYGVSMPTSQYAPSQTFVENQTPTVDPAQMQEAVETAKSTKGGRATR